MKQSHSMPSLTPEFVGVAEKFGMVPEKRAERVLAAFVKGRPRTLKVRADHLPMRPKVRK